MATVSTYRLKARLHPFKNLQSARKQISNKKMQVNYEKYTKFYNF